MSCNDIPVNRLRHYRLADLVDRGILPPDVLEDGCELLALDPDDRYVAASWIRARDPEIRRYRKLAAAA